MVKKFEETKEQRAKEEAAIRNETLAEKTQDKTMLGKIREKLANIAGRASKPPETTPPQTSEAPNKE